MSRALIPAERYPLLQLGPVTSSPGLPYRSHLAACSHTYLKRIYSNRSTIVRIGLIRLGDNNQSQRILEFQFFIQCKHNDHLSQFTFMRHYKMRDLKVFKIVFFKQVDISAQSQIFSK